VSIFGKSPCELLADPWRNTLATGSLKWDEDQWKQFVDAFASNTSLTSLDLSCSSISADAVGKLAKALRHNTSLTTLDLSNNAAVRAQHFVQVLQQNSHLVSLNLSGSSASEEEAERLALALQCNTTLTSLTLPKSIDEQTVWTISAFLRRNKQHGKRKQLLLVVEFREVNYKMKLAVASLVGLHASILRHISVHHPALADSCDWWLEVEDADFEGTFVRLTQMEMIHAGTCKLRLREASTGGGTAILVRQPFQWSAKFLNQMGWVTREPTTAPCYRLLQLPILPSLSKAAGGVEDLLDLLTVMRLKWTEAAIREAFAIDNRQLEHSFMSYRAMLGNMWRAKNAKPSLDNSQLRELAGRLDSWNAGEMVKVVPMFYGTCEQSLWQICESGFSCVETPGDGQHRRGIHFTSSFAYARHNAKPNRKGLRPILVAVTTPGNMSESFDLLVGEPRYQSQYSVVSGPTATKPGGSEEETVHDELVLFQHAQAMPKYIIYVA